MGVPWLSDADESLSDFCLGEEAEAVLNSTNTTEEESKEYNTVIGKFDAFFKVRKMSSLKKLGSTGENSWKVN